MKECSIKRLNSQWRKWGYSLLPHHALSRLAGWICRIEAPWFRQRLIRWFIAKYHVDMSLAADPDPDHYVSFNAFFTRHLREGVRPINADIKSLVSPADGQISQFGEIHAGQLLQAKGVNYAVSSLLAEDSNVFEGGNFMTIYLSPKDYHRVHMPYSGVLTRMVYVPGRLFSVNQFSSTHIPQLFARNERVIFWFNTDRGPMAVIMVGAMLVASVHTVWSGCVCPQRSREIQITEYADQKLQLNKGDELGFFELGSTVIMCLPQQTLRWQADLKVGNTVVMGQALGEIL